ncbi:MAG: M3 family metallopeptidase, partial [Elusimicrobiota bacterium]
LGPSLDFDLSPSRIASIFASAKAEYSAALDRVAAPAHAPAPARTFANTVAVLEEAQARFMESVNTASFLSSVSPDKAVRDAARTLDEETESFLIETSQREDVYRAVREAADKGEPLSGEDRRLLDATLRSYAREGMELPAAKRVRGREVQKRLSELSIAFSENLKDDQDALEVDPARLADLPADFVSGLPRTAGGKVRVGLDYPTYRQVMKHSPDAGLRRELESKFNNQAADKNVPLLEEALALRHEQASLLGYSSYADYAIEERMAKSPAKVWDFLLRLKSSYTTGPRPSCGTSMIGSGGFKTERKSSAASSTQTTRKL